MPKTPLDFGKGFYETKESAFASMDSLNMFPRAAEGDAVSNYYSVQVPSLQGIGDTFSQGQFFRGSVVHKGELYAIYSNRLYKFDTGTNNWVTQLSSTQGNTPINVAGDQTKLAGIASNGIVIAITIQNNSPFLGFGDFFYDPDTATGFSMNQSPSFEYGTLAPNGSIDVTFLDGYFVMVGDDSDGSPRCYHSSLKTINDGKDFRTTDITFLDAAEGSASSITSISGQLVAVCTFHMEFFQNVGGANFAFQRLKGQTQYIGFPNRGFKVQYGDDMYFLGQRRNQRFSVYSLRSGRISNNPIDTYFEEQVPSSEFKSIRSWAYRYDGEEFVGFNMIKDFNPSNQLGRTFVYGLGSGLWHRRETQYQTATESDCPYWIQESQTIDNKLVFLGDSTLTGRGAAIYSDDGDGSEYAGDFSNLYGLGMNNRYEITAPFVQNDGNGIITNSISIYVAGAERQEYELLYKDNPVLPSYDSLGAITLGPELLDGNQTKLEWRRGGFTPTQRLYKITAKRGISNARIALRIIKGIADVEVLNG